MPVFCRRDAFSLFLLLSVLLPLCTGLTLPIPIGPYNTSLLQFPLTDSSRNDPFAPTPQPRRLMVSLFTPLTNSQHPHCALEPYMDPLTAKVQDQFIGAAIGSNITGFFESLALHLCSATTSPDCPTRFPLLLFSHGLSGGRLQYSTLIQSLTSEGYVVASVDHPYDANVVVFPDGSAIYGTINSNNLTLLQEDIGVRAADLHFVLETLTSAAPTKPLILGLQNVPGACATDLLASIDPHRVGVFGHSLGGTSALATILTQRHSRHRTPIRAGANFDGTFYFPLPPFNPSDRPTKTPFLLFEAPLHNQTSDPTWAAEWPLLRGPRIQVELADALHDTFTDLPTIADVSGLRDAFPNVTASTIGTLSGAATVQGIVGSVNRWMAEWVTGEKGCHNDRIDNVKVINGSWCGA